MTNTRTMLLNACNLFLMRHNHIIIDADAYDRETWPTVNIVSKDDLGEYHFIKILERWAIVDNDNYRENTAFRRNDLSAYCEENYVPEDAVKHLDLINIMHYSDDMSQIKLYKDVAKSE